MTRPLWLSILSLAAAPTLCLWMAAAHAAIHTDKPVQETAPVASKHTICTKLVIVLMRTIGEDGEVHVAILPVEVSVPCKS